MAHVMYVDTANIHPRAMLPLIYHQSLSVHFLLGNQTGQQRPDVTCMFFCLGTSAFVWRCL
jgi:hypothetical protein